MASGLAHSNVEPVSVDDAGEYSDVTVPPLVDDETRHAVAHRDDTLSQVSDGAGLEWAVAFRDPSDPFTAELVFTEDYETVLWMNLNPGSTTSLVTALQLVHAQQVSYMTGQPVDTVTPLGLNHLHRVSRTQAQSASVATSRDQQNRHTRPGDRRPANGQSQRSAKRRTKTSRRRTIWLSIIGGVIMASYLYAAINHH